MKLPDLTDLYRHMEWADASVWRAVRDSENGQSDQKLRELFYHLHLVQHAFLRAWRGVPPDTPYPTFDECDSLMRWGQRYFADVFAHLENLNEEEISKTMPLPWSEIVARELGREPAESSFADTMLQVPLHSQYHRGQINARLRAIGGEPPRVDYIVWVWLGRPAADWKVIQ
jgi:uncharacterized damage-inducible protein DinB